MGWGVGANDVEAVLRSLPSLTLRYAAQDRAGRALAHLVDEAARGRRTCCIRRCPARPGHAHWAALCTQAAGLFSVVFDEPLRAARRSMPSSMR